MMSIVAGLVLLTSLKKPAHERAATFLNVGYGTDARQKMDVYLPANRSTDSTKVIFLIHGGGWNGGDKLDFNNYVATLKKRFPHHALVNINYRLAANARGYFPAQENDVQSAVDFLYRQRQAYGISDKWIFLGASAGAHLALLQSYKHSQPVKPIAVVSFFGPADLTAMYHYHPLVAMALQKVTGTTPSANAALYEQSSPYNFINAQSPPTLLFHGGQDPLVPAVQSTMVRDKLQMLGVPNEYVFYPNAGHGWFGADLTDSFNKMEAFLIANVR